MNGINSFCTSVRNSGISHFLHFSALLCKTSLFSGLISAFVKSAITCFRARSEGLDILDRLGERTTILSILKSKGETRQNRQF